MTGEYWERRWKAEDPDELGRYLDMYHGLQCREIEIFKEHNAVNICDAACGFGAYTLAFASNGFRVHGFDISETSVKLTVNGLKRYGIDSTNVKVASILDTGYADGFFDGVIAHAVLDHLTAEDGRRALNELLRITAPGGLVMASFDKAEEDDFEEAHVVLEDGTLQYVDGVRHGMLFRPYDWEKIDVLLGATRVIYRAEHQRERTVIIRK